MNTKNTNKAKTRGAITKKLLDLIEGFAYTTEGLFDAFFTDYAASYRRLRGLDRESDLSSLTAEELRQLERQRFYNMISNLKKQGLIAVTDRGNWRITEKGKERSKLIISRAKIALPAPSYEKLSAKEIKIIVFDIPERERRKRVWLRSALQHLGFKKLQKSVWIGKVGISEAFMEDMRGTGIIEFVEIFAVTKTGTLRKVS